MTQRVPIIDGKTKCSRCKETKAVGEFGVCNRRWSGIELCCKECRKKRNAVPRLRLRPPQHDKCPRCGADKCITSNICLTCRYRRPEIEQPADPAIRLIPLTKGQVAIIGADYYEWAMRWQWYAKYYRHIRGYYAARRGVAGEPRDVFLHRQLMGEPDEQVDHINGVTLDCRMQNLRICSSQQNGANRGLRSDNTSGHVGVEAVGDKWRAVITIGGKRFNLGTFDKLEDAIAARVYAELVYFGEFAPSARDLLILPSNLQAAA